MISKESVMIDLFYLAGGLHDDDCYYGDQRKAPAILIRAWIVMGKDKPKEKYLRDVLGDEKFENELAEHERKWGK